MIVGRSWLLKHSRKGGIPAGWDGVVLSRELGTCVRFDNWILTFWQSERLRGFDSVDIRRCHFNERRCENLHSCHANGRLIVCGSTQSFFSSNILETQTDAPGHWEVL